MGARFKHLANVCALPLPDPIVDTNSITFTQLIDKRFRKRAMITAVVTILVFTGVMIHTFPYIMGLKPIPSGVNARRYMGLFYYAPVFIIYSSWWFTRVIRNKGYVRQVRITSTSITLNKRTLKTTSLIRGPVRIQHHKETRPIEAIRIKSGRRSYIIAAKDDPSELDQIESMIPQRVQTTTDEVELKGVL